MQTCSLCQRTIPDAEPSVWHHDSGASVTVKASVESLVVIDTPSGEFWVCEQCYLGALPSSFSSAQLRELHEQFAIEYRDRHRFAEAISACERALEFGDSADTLALLAYIHGELDHRTEAEALYHRALAIEPNHFIATNNLERLLHANGSP